ncbi:conserved hypothetical protein [Rhizobium rhizogenes K84]|uniref:DUF4145 domain-containing protein n=1 Tax=Rhizobium rhizogenes (strain K84 / ATCC BAA-868) TaxID=311403 RepID=B9JF61_RHIR8|nr:conserved hypothetical protein [Rhizobium rhizogenes K84]
MSATNYDISRFKTNVSNSSLPDHLPDDVLKAFQQAETNFDLENHEEAAATMYRRALERALKSSHPNLAGTLAAKIKTLVGGGELPKSLGDWADEIRLIGNDGAHDDGVTRDELKAARMFCDSFLRYLITLPTEVALRRSQPT